MITELTPVIWWLTLIVSLVAIAAHKELISTLRILIIGNEKSYLPTAITSSLCFVTSVLYIDKAEVMLPLINANPIISFYFGLILLIATSLIAIKTYNNFRADHYRMQAVLSKK